MLKTITPSEEKKKDERHPSACYAQRINFSRSWAYLGIRPINLKNNSISQRHGDSESRNGVGKLCLSHSYYVVG